MSAAIESRSTESVLKHDGADSIEFDANGVKSGLGSAFAGAINGLTLSNNVSDANNDIDIAAGGARDAQDTYTMNLDSIMTKQLDAIWAAGTNMGGLFSGTKAIDTWYHVFLIRKDSDGSIDAGFDTSVSAANIPAGYTSYRRLGSILTDGSGNIIAFTVIQSGGDVRYQWLTGFNDYSSTFPTASSLITLTVPTGYQVIALTHFRGDGGGGSIGAVVGHPDTTAFSSVYNFRVNDTGTTTRESQNLEPITNDSAQILVDASAAGVNLTINTWGWIDPRG